MYSPTILSIYGKSADEESRLSQMMKPGGTPGHLLGVLARARLVGIVAAPNV
jgi:hypothetical protein